MLISRRREGDIIRIGDDIEIRIVSVRRSKVLIGVVAPREVKVTASRLSPIEMANTMAAADSDNLGKLLTGTPAAAEPAVPLLKRSQ